MAEEPALSIEERTSAYLARACELLHQVSSGRHGAQSVARNLQEQQAVNGRLSEKDTEPLCRHCANLLVPGVNCHIRVRSSKSTRASKDVDNRETSINIHHTGHSKGAVGNEATVTAGPGGGVRPGDTVSIQRARWPKPVYTIRYTYCYRCGQHDRVKLVKRTAKKRAQQRKSRVHLGDLLKQAVLIPAPGDNTMTTTTTTMASTTTTPTPTTTAAAASTTTTAATTGMDVDSPGKDIIKPDTVSGKRAGTTPTPLPTRAQTTGDRRPKGVTPSSRGARTKGGPHDKVQGGIAAKAKGKKGKRKDALKSLLQKNMKSKGGGKKGSKDGQSGNSLYDFLSSI